MSTLLPGQVVYHVSPRGSDENPGTADKPFASLQHARDAVRLAKRQPGFAGATVRVNAGVYPISRGLELTDADSGTAQAPVRYCAGAGKPARLIGGIVVPAAAFKPAADGPDRARLHRTAARKILVADLAALGVKNLPVWPDKTRGGSGMPELFFDAQPMQVARWPNKGWVTIEKVISAGAKRAMFAGPVSGSGGGVFQYSDPRPAAWNASAGVWLSGYWCHDWADETLRIKSIDADKKTIALAAPHGYGIGGSGKRRYFAINLLEELDAPGESYLDAKGLRLYFHPPADLASGEVVLSLLTEPLIKLSGASHVTVEGLTLEACRNAAVMIEGGQGVRISGCQIRNTGRAGVVIASGTDHGVGGCQISNTGTVGISIAGGDRKTLTPAGNWAADNHIHHFSRLQRTYAPAVSLQGVGNRVSHSLIHDAPHCAVLFGGNENVIEFNEFHSVCQETGDVGVIYTGRDWTVRGNVIRHNYIHDVKGPGVYGAQGVYLDDCASGTIVRGNVFVKVQRALQIGGGRDNVIENNLVVDCPASLAFDNRGLGWMKHHVGKDGVMPKRLTDMPYKTPPWSTKYPPLLTLLGDEPGSPKGNVVRHNVIAAAGAMQLAGEVTRYGTVSDNLVLKTAPKLPLAPASEVFKKLPAFKPIPFDQIGPRRHTEQQGQPTH
ncbi:MAG: right-handed parallel beta-helix repeat-containing protein [Planctomycetaceae bacterium]|nr:right-handed parallel beta-helix repeat-containing protein [Planctomycetaceae bacterium]